ncbi:hypothetical protein COO60DRAFT_641713 [Scenedesmus sp. NREL 46B-D3]|nr:hypothetical protein COO60DRAFT_641713 [Scenedesmus sp. NREL 46B-D3]
MLHCIVLAFCNLIAQFSPLLFVDTRSSAAHPHVCCCCCCCCCFRWRRTPPSLSEARTRLRWVRTALTSGASGRLSRTRARASATRARPSSSRRAREEARRSRAVHSELLCWTSQASQWLDLFGGVFCMAVLLALHRPGAAAAAVAAALACCLFFYAAVWSGVLASVDKCRFEGL